MTTDYFPGRCRPRSPDGLTSTNTSLITCCLRGSVTRVVRWLDSGRLALAPLAARGMRMLVWRALELGPGAPWPGPCELSGAGVAREGGKMNSCYMVAVRRSDGAALGTRLVGAG